LARPDLSDRRLLVVIAPSQARASRQPVETALAAAIGVVNKAGAGSLPLRGHDQGGERQLGAPVIAHGPADDLSRRAVEHGCQAPPSLAGGDGGGAGQPDAGLGAGATDLRPGRVGAIGGS